MIQTEPLPALLPLNSSIIRIDQDDATSQDFLDGLRSGQDTYAALIAPCAGLTDAEITCLIFSHQQPVISPAFNTGLFLGWCSSLIAQAGDSIPFDIYEKDFDDGYEDGILACYSRSDWQMLPIMTLSELIGLVARCCRANNFYHAGLLVGYVYALSRPGCSAAHLEVA
jgi:hypothetical protein